MATTHISKKVFSSLLKCPMALIRLVLLIYVHCADNNKSATVLDQFEKGVARDGLTSTVRSDHGMKNFGVAAYMLEHRGLRRGGIITRFSVHNCRVERVH